MSSQSLHANDQLRKAIGKLIRGLEKRERELRERRQYHRFNFGVKVGLCKKSPGGNLEKYCDAWALDLSIGGIGFMSEHTINVGDVVYISFEDLIGTHSYIPIIVRNSRHLVGSVYQVNGQFDFDTEAES